MFTFKPLEDEKAVIPIPYLEDARADYAPYYTITRKSGQSIEKAKSQVVAELVKLGGQGPVFTPGTFGENPTRYGYMITFWLDGNQARMNCAGLPIRNYSESLKERALFQSLMILRDWLKSAVTSRVFSPGSHPLVPYLLTDNGQTWVERLVTEGQIPLLEG